LEEASSSSDCSSVCSTNVQTIPNNFVSPDLSLPDESAGIINYPSSESCQAGEDKESVIAETFDESSGSSSTAEHVESQQEFDTLCKSVLE
jgi:hypothetical protein